MELFRAPTSFHIAVSHSGVSRSRNLLTSCAKTATLTHQLVLTSRTVVVDSHQLLTSLSPPHSFGILGSEVIAVLANAGERPGQAKRNSHEISEDNLLQLSHMQIATLVRSKVEGSQLFRSIAGASKPSL